MGTENYSRHRFTVPNEDTTVIDFINAQSNLSMSLRMLIRRYVEKDGYTDVTCARVEQLPKRGRPPKAQAEEYDDEDMMPSVPVKAKAEAEPDMQASVMAEEELQEEPVAPADDPLASLAGDDAQTSKAKPKKTPASKAPVADDDGFVDPESLLSGMM